VWKNIQTRTAIGIVLPPKIPSAPATAPVPASVPEPEGDSSHLSECLQTYGGEADMDAKRRMVVSVMPRLHEGDLNDPREMDEKAECGSLVLLYSQHLSIQSDEQA